MPEYVGSILWLSSVYLYSRWLTRFIEPWPQWMIVFGVMLLVAGVGVLGVLSHLAISWTP